MIVACAGTERAVHFEATELLLRSRFALVASHRGEQPAALADALLLGAVPVILEHGWGDGGVEGGGGEEGRGLLLPFCQLADWGTFSIRLRADRVADLPRMLRAITAGELKRMQRNLAQANALFRFPYNTALAIVQLRIGELQSGLARGEGVEDGEGDDGEETRGAL